MVIVMETLPGIAEISEHTGLTKDTLRWYEREGLIPEVVRGSDGRRRYDERTVGLIQLLVRLRRTSMPVRQIRHFIKLLHEGAASHGRRKALLAEHRTRLVQQMQELQDDLSALDAKIVHYDALIATGRDCNDAPIVDPVILARQPTSTTPHDI